MDNIIFDKIIINNFFSIGNAEVDLNDQGFVLVRGTNKEGNVVQSNGSGKSTIFDAIFWTLTGDTIRGATDVVNEHHKSVGCSCELYFHSITDTYIIKRYKSHNEHGNSCHFYINDELITDQTKKSQEMIVKTLPSVSSSEVLGSIILLGQGLPYKFSSYGPSKRKDLLETMSGSSSEISKVRYKLDVEESSHNAAKSTLEKENATYSGLISGHNNTISILNQQIDKFIPKEDSDKKVHDLESKIQGYQNTIKEYQIKIDDISKLLSSYQDVLVSADKYRSQLDAELISITSQISAIKSGSCPTCGRPYEVTDEMMSKRAELESKYAEVSAKYDTMSNKCKNTSDQIDSYKKEISDLQSSISQCNYLINQCNNEICELNKNSDNIQSIKDKIDQLDKEISLLRVKINENLELIDKEQELLDCISYLKRQLSRDFKGYMLDEVIKFMSSRSEYYSNYLFTTDNKVKITLSGNKILISIGDRLYENLSGGERQRVDLAVQFALRDMLVTTSGFSCNLLVLDEAFDNLDAQGSDSLMNLVVSEFSDVNSVYVVTHHSEIDIPYDQQIDVIKGNDGISYLR